MPAFAASSTVDFVNAPAGGVVELAVGETYTAVFEVDSSVEFISATAMADAFYPGRIVATKPARTGAGTAATLELDFTGKAATTNTIDNTNPIVINVGVRYPGGVVEVHQFPVDFVLVP